jgi:leucyl-tRNA synthetase
MGENGSVHASEWPKVEEKYLVENEITIPVAINGKVRGQLKIESLKSKAENEKEIVELAKDLEEVKKWLESKKIIKEIYVPGKMVNIVVK